MYKIKFRKKPRSNSMGVSVPIYHEQMFEDVRIDKMCKRTETNPMPTWRVLGLMSVASIEVLKGAQKSYREVVEAFYPEGMIEASEREIKAQLLKADPKKPEKDAEPKSKEPETDDELELLKAEADELGVKYSAQIGKEKLQQRIDEHKNQE